MSSDPIGPSHVGVDGSSRAGVVSGARSTNLTRNDVLALGQSGRPWEFVPIGETAVALVPDDADVLFLLAANYARLGLVTPARERLARLTAMVGPQAEVAQLQAAIEVLPRDAMGSDSVESHARRGMLALAERGHEVVRDFEAWRSTLHEFEWFGTLDGNVVRRRRSGGWAMWGAHAQWSNASVPILPPGGGATPSGAMMIVGVDPPMGFQVACERRPRSALGAWPPIDVVVADTESLFHGLGIRDVSALLLEDRTRVHVGQAGLDALRDRLLQTSDYLVPRNVIAIPGTPRLLSAQVERLSHAAVAKAVSDAAAYEQRLVARPKRGPLWWSDRYARAMDGRGPRLRVLVMGCRFSTVVEHSARDAVAALEASGVDVRLLIEPDDSSQLARAAILRAFVEFDPDLCMTLNFPRAALNEMGGGNAMFAPPDVPWVTWIQDAMPHLFRESVAAAQGPLDFVVGHEHRLMFASGLGAAGRSRGGYVRERFLPTPVLASSGKFHPGPVDADLRLRFACDIAFITNHSQRPESLRDDMLRQSADVSWRRRAVADIFDGVRELSCDWMARSISIRLREITAAALARAGVEPDEGVVEQMRNQVAVPIADRFFRQETMEFAANIARRRGWRLNIYGRGWEAHPKLAAYSRGNVPHGEELRAAYQCARVSVHVSVNWPLHQRVLECSLAGGVPIARLRPEDIDAADTVLSELCSRECEPLFTTLWPGTLTKNQVWGHCAAHWRWMSWTAMKQRLGIERSWGPLMTDGPAAKGTTEVEAIRAAPALYLFRDWSETMFRDERELEAIIERATSTNDRWREQTSRGARSRVESVFTYEKFMPKMLAWLRDRLDTSAKEAAP
jgi:hypothetical protein